jgi:hypothetical protein
MAIVSLTSGATPRALTPRGGGDGDAGHEDADAAEVRADPVASLRALGVLSFVEIRVNEAGPELLGPPFVDGRRLTCCPALGDMAPLLESGLVGELDTRRLVSVEDLTAALEGL